MMSIVCAQDNETVDCLEKTWGPCKQRADLDLVNILIYCQNGSTCRRKIALVNR